jgi:hypothetical protein
MVLSRLEDWGVEPVPYDEVSELNAVIAGWLPER